MAKAPPEDYKYETFLQLLSPKGSQTKIGIALFGLGRAGTIHLRNLFENPRVEILYVVEENVEKLSEIKEWLGMSSINFVNSNETDKVLSDSKVKAVVIATPTQSHQAIVLLALENGKAVFCEKPLANDVNDVKSCYDKAAKLGLPLLCAFNRRFDPAFTNVQNRVSRGEIGQVHMVKTCSRDSPLPSVEYLKTSNGIFHDCAVHDIDLVIFILGELPTKVFASAVAHRKEIKQLNDHDTVAIHLTFPSGAMALIDLSRFAIYGYDQRLEVFGPGGMLSCGNQNTLAVQSYVQSGVQEPPIWYSFASRYQDAYKREMDHFLNVVEGKEELRITARETLAVCQIALACEESVRTGQSVTVTYI